MLFNSNDSGIVRSINQSDELGARHLTMRDQRGDGKTEARPQCELKASWSDASVLSLSKDPNAFVWSSNLGGTKISLRFWPILN